MGQEVSTVKRGALSSSFPFIFFLWLFLSKKSFQSVFLLGFYHTYPEACSLTYLISGFRYLKLLDLYPSQSD